MKDPTLTPIIPKACKCEHSPGETAAWCCNVCGLPVGKDYKNQLTRLRSLAEKVKATVDKQAEDSALWFINSTASEAYLQQELRKLHADVEQLSDYLKENK